MTALTFAEGAHRLSLQLVLTMPLEGRDGSQLPLMPESQGNECSCSKPPRQSGQSWDATPLTTSATLFLAVVLPVLPEPPGSALGFHICFSQRLLQAHTHLIIIRPKSYSAWCRPLDSVTEKTVQPV